MKKYTFVWLLLAALLSVCGTQDAFALSLGGLFKKSIQPEHRVCEKDVDCTRIEISCEACGGEYDAVNGKFADTYKSLGQCSEEEIINLQRSNCVIVKESVAVCKNHHCALDWKDIPH
jgi:hypothetical protein